MLELKTKVICEKKDHLQMAKNAQIILTTNEIGVALLDDQSKLVNIPLNEPVLMSSFNVDEPEKAVKKTYKFIYVLKIVYIYESQDLYSICNFNRIRVFTLHCDG